MAKIRAVVVEGDRERGYKRVQVLLNADTKESKFFLERILLSK